MRCDDDAIFPFFRNVTCEMNKAVSVMLRAIAKNTVKHSYTNTPKHIFHNSQISKHMERTRYSQVSTRFDRSSFFFSFFANIVRTFKMYTSIFQQTQSQPHCEFENQIERRVPKQGNYFQEQRQTNTIKLKQNPKKEITNINRLKKNELFYGFICFRDFSSKRKK